VKSAAVGILIDAGAAWDMIVTAGRCRSARCRVSQLTRGKNRAAHLTASRPKPVLFGGRMLQGQEPCKRAQRRLTRNDRNAEGKQQEQRTNDTKDKSNRLGTIDRPSLFAPIVLLLSALALPLWFAACAMRRSQPIPTARRRRRRSRRRRCRRFAARRSFALALSDTRTINLRTATATD
jgi:hypothetical protein